MTFRPPENCGNGMKKYGLNPSEVSDLVPVKSANARAVAATEFAVAPVPKLGCDELSAEKSLLKLVVVYGTPEEFRNSPMRHGVGAAALDITSIQSSRKFVPGQRGSVARIFAWLTLYPPVRLRPRL